MEVDRPIRTGDNRFAEAGRGILLGKTHLEPDGRDDIHGAQQPVSESARDTGQRERGKTKDSDSSSRTIEDAIRPVRRLRFRRVEDSLPAVVTILRASARFGGDRIS